MPSSTAAPPNTLLLARQSIHHLRQVLERDAGMQAATWLQEAGFAGGEALYEAYTEWLAERYAVRRPASLDVRHLGETLSAFFEEYGWGTVRVTPMTSAVIALDSTDWGEADPASGASLPVLPFLLGAPGRVPQPGLGIDPGGDGGGVPFARRCALPVPGRRAGDAADPL